MLITLKVQISFQLQTKQKVFVRFLSFYFSGVNRAIVSTYESDTGYDLENFQLKTLARSYGIASILCEKGKTSLVLFRHILSIICPKGGTVSA